MKVLELSEEELKELQKKNIEILEKFLAFCKEHSLKVFACGGGCIGAVRHKGFIPWDDDIDLFMLREDYEWLKKNFNRLYDTDDLYFEVTTKTHYTRVQIGTIVDENTTFVKERQADLKDVHHGVRIDILPLDGCPESRIKRKIQILWALIYSMFIVGEPHTSKGKFLETISRIMLFFFRSNKSRYLIWHLAEKKMSKYSIKNCNKITELCAWYQYMVNEYPKEIFEGAVMLDFEKTELPVPKGYDEYLKIAFGDYMTLPPESERIPKHDVVEFNINKSYKERI